MANNAASTTRTGQVPTQPGGGLTCNSGGRPINGGGTDGMNWPAMIARCSSYDDCCEDAPAHDLSQDRISLCAPGGVRRTSRHAAPARRPRPAGALEHALVSIESAPSTEKIPLCRKDVPLRPKMRCYVSSRAF